MRIAVPAETFEHEARVAATPETVKKYIDAGCEVVVQKGAGIASSIPDDRYTDAGATLADSFAATCAGANLVLKVRSPSGDEISAIDKGAAVVALFSPSTNPDLNEYNSHELTCFSLEMIPRITRAQSMDVLSSQANVAGYRAVLLACEHYSRFMPMMMTAAGTVHPARVLVMGAGVAGLQAIATARRLGASVEAFDVRAAAREQVESLGARFVEVESDEDAETEGGYAREMSEDYKRRQSELVARHVAGADIVITTALIPGRPAPVLITEEMVATMKPGSVIVDLAAEAGGNCPLTRKDEVYENNGVTFVGLSNVPSLMAADASSLLARNIFNFVASMLDTEDGRLSFDMEDEVIESSLLCRGGRFLKEQFLQGGES